FTEVLLKFNIPNEKLNLFPSFSDLKSNRDIKLRNHVLFKTDFSKNKFLSPIIVKRMGSESNYSLVNFDSTIPFDNNSYTLIFPITDFSVDSLIVTLESSIDTLRFVVTKFFDSQIVIELNEQININLTQNENLKTRNFIFDNFSTKLSEDKLKIKVETNERKTPIVFHKEVKWINKPKSLHNIDFAIKMLNYIEDENVVASIKKAKNESIALYNYWGKIDPSKETKFNELMYEFYTRVDYAVKNFTTVGVKNGAESDRGKVFIVYGEPSEIARINNHLGKVSEIWSYQKLGKSFTFIDKSGTGKFDLVEVK
ncbi:MAG TPA: GWxTD domain-containing protein, partial [Ignavibacteriaceae bacterium]|nr:GWxTD domain-containing protein [Ignavibacteriaceae bacterium]